MTRIVVRLLLPFILSLLPYFTLLRESDAERKSLRDESEKNWLSNTSQAVQQIRRASAPSFWPQALSRHFRHRIEETVARGISRGEYSGKTPELARIISAVVSGSRLRAFPQPRVWAISFPHGSIEAPSELCVGPFLATESRFLISSLLQETVRFASGYSSSLAEPTWESRLRNIFGIAISSEFFQKSFQSLSIPVIFGRSGGFITWNILRAQGKPIGAFLLYQPLPHDSPSLGLQELLTNWRHPHLHPVFLPFPVTFGAARGEVIARPDFTSASARFVIDEVQSRFQLSPPSHRYNNIGAVRLPTYMADRMLVSKGWRFRLFPLAPECQRFGLLFERHRQPPRHVFGRLVRLYGAGLIIVWSCLLLTVIRRGDLPVLGVRKSLMLWFLGIIAVPLILGISAGRKNIEDMRSNLITAVERETASILETIDEESSSIIPDQQLKLNRIFSDQRLTRDFKDVQFGKTASETVLQRLWEEIRLVGFHPYIFTLLGFDGFKISKSQTGFNRKSDVFLIDMLESGLESRLNGEQKPDVAFPARAVKPRSAGSTLLLDSLKISMGRSTILDSIEKDWFGETHWMSLNTRIRMDGKVWFMAGLLWDQDPVFIKFLDSRIASSSSLSPDIARTRRIRITAFQASDHGFKPVASSGRISEELRKVAALGRSDRMISTSHIEGEPWLLYAMPSKRMPGFILAAQIPLTDVFTQIRQETRSTILLFSAIMFLVFMVAKVLSDFLAWPIERMSHGLEEIAAGNLDVSVREERADELGTVSRTIDRMTLILRERRKVSRFVSPQVLHVIAGGSLDQAGHSGLHEMAVLASDMRNFTTISETQDPRAVFSMLNTHIAAMTKAIESHGGIIDRFIGDAIVAVFHPRPDRPAAARAVDAAREMMQIHEAIQKDRRSRNVFPYSIGIGIDEGTVISGVIGDEETRLEFTVLGDPISSANELEALSKSGTSSLIIVSGRIKSQLPDSNFTRLGEFIEGWELSPNAIPADQSRAVAILTEPTPPRSELMREPTGAPEISQESLPDAPCPSDRPGFYSRWRAASFACVLCLVPAILVLGAYFQLKWTRDEIARQRARQTLLDDASWLTKTFDPCLQIPRFIQEVIQRRVPDYREGSRNKDNQLLLRETLAEGLTEIQGRLPGLSYAWCPLVPAPGKPNSTDSLTFNGLAPGETGFFSRTPGPPLASSQLWLIAQAANQTVSEWVAFREESSDILYRWGKGEISKALRHQFPKSPLLPSLTSPKPMDISGTATNLYWFPVILNDRDQSQRTFRESNDFERREFEQAPWHRYSGKNLQQRTLGILVFFLPPTLLDPRSSIPLLVEDMQKRGTEVIPLKTAVSPETRPDDEITLTTTVRFDDRTFCFRLQKALPPQGFGINLGVLLLTGLWLLAGGKLFLDVLRMGYFPGFRLSSLLTGAFLVVIIPLLTSTFFFIERSHLEGALRLEHDEFAKIEKQAHTFDESGAFGYAWSHALFDDLSKRLSFTISPSRPVAAPTEDLEAFFQKATRRGLRPEVIHFFDTSGSIWSFPTGPTEQAADGLAVLGKVHSFLFRNNFTALGAPVLERRQQGKLHQDNDELLIGIEFEELRKVFCKSFGFINVARMILGEMYNGEWLIRGANRLFYFRKILRIGGVPRSELQATYPEQFIPHLFNSWLMKDPRWGIPRLDFAIVNQSFPRGFVYSPCAVFLGERSCDGVPLISFLQAPHSLLSIVSTLTNEPIRASLGTGEQRRLVYAFPSQTAEKWLYLFQSPIGQLLREASIQAFQNRLALLAVLIVAFILSPQIAGIFLQPVVHLSEAVREITLGNYAVRLTVESHDEFGQLFKAFNHMATEAQEGRLLGKFVSNSVRGLAVDRDREKAAREGEKRETVILFAGLSGFKDLIKSRNPADLVQHLNDHLSAMSKILREHGGEIDKFIGDKVLAVFHHDSSSAPFSPARQALSAALEMQKTARRRADLPGHLGIGITSGHVLAGILGTEAVRLEYTVIGDTVNLASRLSDLAAKQPEGGILIDGETAGSLDGAEKPSAYSLARQETTRIKGKSREVTIFAVTAEAARKGSQ